MFMPFNAIVWPHRLCVFLVQLPGNQFAHFEHRRRRVLIQRVQHIVDRQNVQAFDLFDRVGRMVVRLILDQHLSRLVHRDYARLAAAVAVARAQPIGAIARPVVLEVRVAGQY